MLIQFAVENFKSFRDKAVLSMVASDSAPHPEHMVVTTASGLKLLKCAAIYGANASGKSNLIQALEFAREIVTGGTSFPFIMGVVRGDAIPISAFRLDARSQHRGSRFEFEFYRQGRQYAYGFELDSQKILNEWLVITGEPQDSVLFERTFVPDDPERPAIEFGSSLIADVERKSFLSFVAKGTRSNQLFATEAALRNVTEVTEILGWFWNGLQIPIKYPLFRSSHAAERVESDERFREFLAALLARADTGISGISVRREKSGFTVGSTSSPETLQIDLFSLVLHHRGADGSIAPFELREESDGTRRLIELAYVLHDAANDVLFAIDEIESSLHPLLTRFFLNTFLQNGTGSAPGQLIFSTHDTNLLDLSLVSRDAIWFVEKDQDGASTLYSLAEFKQEQLDALTDQVEKGYLIGRFGGIPFFGDASRLGWIAKDSTP